MPTVLVQLNNDLFEVDADELEAVEMNAYTLTDDGEDVVKDWAKVTEWVELHGVYKSEADAT